jgi:hypothetical protein
MVTVDAHENVISLNAFLCGIACRIQLRDEKAWGHHIIALIEQGHAFTFDAKGASTYDLTKAVVGKKEAGAQYGMKTYGGAAKEWYEQSAAFDAATIGKTADEIRSLLGQNNYGNADLQAAGCTILVNGLVSAASKIG